MVLPTKFKKIQGKKFKMSNNGVSYYVLRFLSWEHLQKGKYEVKVFPAGAISDIVKFINSHIYFIFKSEDEVNKFVHGFAKKEIKPKPKVREIYKKEIFVSDLQIPFQDNKAVDIFFDLAGKVEPDIIFLGGDIIDFYSISPFLKNNEFIDIRYEVQKVVAFLMRLRKEFPRAKIYYMQGNHEWRIFRELWRNGTSVLAPVSNYVMHPVNMFHLAKFDIEYLDEPFRIGVLYHLHGHEAKSRGRIEHVALNLLRRWGENLICGHFHRFDEFVVKALDGTLKVAYINGCLFDITSAPQPYYRPDDTAQKGFSYIVYDKNGFFDVDQVIFIETRNGNGNTLNGKVLSKMFESVEYTVFFNGNIYRY